ncbi:MAG: hypothetical protein ABIR04_14435 [Cypionkella sp.]
MNDPVSSRQVDLLEKEDWRFHAVGPLGTGVGMIATTERASKLSNRVRSFGLPSAPALYLNLAMNARKKRSTFNLAAAFEDHPHPQGIYPEDHEMLFDFFQEFSAEVIFSFTALEAFVNEVIPANFVYEWVNSKKEKMALSRQEVERQVSLDEKLKKVLPIAHNVKSPIGTIYWQNYKVLKKARDRLIHLKSVDRTASGPEHQTIWGHMIAEKDTNFVNAAYSMMGAYPSLIKDRRWYVRAGNLLSKKI